MNEAEEDLLKDLQKRLAEREAISRTAAFDKDNEVYEYSCDMIAAINRCIDALTEQ